MTKGVFERALTKAGIMPVETDAELAEMELKSDRWMRFLPVFSHMGNEVAIREYVSWYSSPKGYDRGCSREDRVLEILDAVIGEFTSGPEFFAWVIAVGGKVGKDRWTDAIVSMIEEFEIYSEPEEGKR